jgi:hypothetical protein
LPHVERWPITALEITRDKQTSSKDIWSGNFHVLSIQTRPRLKYVVTSICIEDTTCVTDTLVLLPGFQKGRDIKASKRKGQGAVLAKKGQFALYMEKTEFHFRWLPDGAGI